ncbi:hypothetical protein POCGH01_API004500 (apicoplast) [Plasmodium ovale]|uniref:Open reading frame 51 n=1 Tax=Plasmodium ovale TaxID=36330 RepID=H7CDE0_PLAOA|nr:open reading frame 51 [Plasmodium ovale]SCQ17355.1 hypothetical protein POCGH01_API004500 [Plasmodium ovale]
MIFYNNNNKNAIINLNYYLNRYKKILKYNKQNKKNNNITYILYKKYILIIKKLRYLNII